MLQLTPLKPNCNMVETDTKIILVSYKTPVACFDKVTGQVLRTDKKWSNTTTRHIKVFFNILSDSRIAAFNPETRDQDYFDRLNP